MRNLSSHLYFFNQAGYFPPFAAGYMSEGNSLPPPKRICLRPAKKGLRCEDVMQHYRVHPGDASKMQCKLCWAAWYAQLADRACQDGLLLTILLILKDAGIPNRDLVLSYNRACSSALRTHLIKAHGAVEVKERPRKSVVEGSLARPP